MAVVVCDHGRHAGGDDLQSIGVSRRKSPDEHSDNSAELSPAIKPQ
jgi:hypothetical protein